MTSLTSSVMKTRGVCGRRSDDCTSNGRSLSVPQQNRETFCSSIVENSLVPLIYFYQDIQAEAPSHLLRLQVEIERRLVMATLQECRVELKREDKALLTAGSERLIKEHRVNTSVNFLQVHADLVLI